MKPSSARTRHFIYGPHEPNCEPDCRRPHVVAWQYDGQTTTIEQFRARLKANDWGARRRQRIKAGCYGLRIQALFEEE